MSTWRQLRVLGDAQRYVKDKQRHKRADDEDILGIWPQVTIATRWCPLSSRSPSYGLSFVQYAFPSFIALLHTVAVLSFASCVVPLAGEQTDAGAMVWVIWIPIDFPLSFLAFHAISYCQTNTSAILCLIGIGGFQWFIWAMLAQTIWKRLARQVQSQKSHNEAVNASRR